MQGILFSWRKFLYVLVCSLLIVGTYQVEMSAAAALTGVSDTMSSETAKATGVTHTVVFAITTTAVLRRVDFRFSTTNGGSTKPAFLNLGSATLGTTTNLDTSNWNINTSSASTGLLTITRPSSGAGNVTSGNTASVELQNITNSAIDDCEPSNVDLTDTCHLAVTTYSDTAGTVEVDTGNTTYTVTEDPSLKFEIYSVAPGTTIDGIVTTDVSTTTALQFGNLKPGDVKYIAQRIKVTTNAPNGYSVKAYLNQNLVGIYASSIISAFAGNSATWTSPQSWSTPDGTIPNTDTGWIGAHTDDGRVTGWGGSVNGKFGPMSGIAHEVAYSNGPDRAGTDVYVVYALGINSIQPSDIYTGNVIYGVQASY